MPKGQNLSLRVFRTGKGKIYYNPRGNDFFDDDFDNMTPVAQLTDIIIVRLGDSEENNMGVLQLVNKLLQLVNKLRGRPEVDDLVFALSNSRNLQIWWAL